MDFQGQFTLNDQAHGQQIAKLVALAVAEEREACAALLEEWAERLETALALDGFSDVVLELRRMKAQELRRCATAIRARGKERHEQ